MPLPSHFMREKIREAQLAEYTKGLEDGVRDTLIHLERALEDGLDIREWIADVRRNLDA